MGGAQRPKSADSGVPFLRVREHFRRCLCDYFISASVWTAVGTQVRLDCYSLIRLSQGPVSTVKAEHFSQSLLIVGTTRILSANPLLKTGDETFPLNCGAGT